MPAAVGINNRFWLNLDDLIVQSPSLDLEVPNRSGSLQTEMGYIQEKQRRGEGVWAQGGRSEMK